MVFAVAVLMLLGFAVRYYHFNEWLYFKMDQSRDAAIIGNAVLNGPEYLPLLGPRAGATTLAHGFLRTGPAYYYMQYFSGVLAGSVEPYVFAYPDLFFGILAIPMLFVLLRLYFPRGTAFGVTTLYTFCFLVIEYSRFAWNPNTLPFFIFLAFYGLLRFLNEIDLKRRYKWLTLWIGALTIGAQLHFFGVFSLIGISGLMVIWHFELWRAEPWRMLRAKSVWLPIVKYTLTGVAIALFLYTPAIISDTYRHGENIHNFFEAMGSKQDKAALSKKLATSLDQNSQYYCLITTAQCMTGSGKSNTLPELATALFILFGIAFSVIRLRKLPAGIQKDFLRLVVVWFAVFSILSIPVASQLRPRFFLVVMALPFILWGVWFEYMQERWKQNGLLAGLVLFIVLFGLNVQGTLAWFHEQSQSQLKDTPVTRTLILKNKDGVTLGQLQRVTDFMYAHLEKGNHLYFYVKPEHISPIKYLLRLKQMNDPGLIYQPMTFNEDPKAQYFVVVPDTAKDPLAPVTAKFGQPFEVIASQKTGQLFVVEIRFTDRPVSADFQIKESASSEDRIFWADVFGNKQAVSVDIQE